MEWKGRRQSDNVEDRRGQSSGRGLGRNPFGRSGIQIPMGGLPLDRQTGAGALQVVEAADVTRLEAGRAPVALEERDLPAALHGREEALVLQRAQFVGQRPHLRAIGDVALEQDIAGRLRLGKEGALVGGQGFAG